MVVFGGAIPVDAVLGTVDGSASEDPARLLRMMGDVLD
jgi:hypothetical protein